MGDYLDKQGVAPFFEMGDRYGAVYQRMLDRLESLDADELERRPNRRNDVDETEAGLAASPWIDIDKTVAEFCKANRRPVPNDIEGAVVIHIEAIDAWIASQFISHSGHQVQVAKPRTGPFRNHGRANLPVIGLRFSQ